MTSRYLLDTDIVSDMTNPRPNAALSDWVALHQEEAAIPSPTWHELLYGAARLPKSKRRTVIESYLHEVVASTLPILSYDAAAADWHASERARLERAGKTPPFVDGQIAAIAVVNELSLVTLNMRHFRVFEGLKLASWH